MVFRGGNGGVPLHHMARNCWGKRKARVADMPQESAKENGGQ